MKRKLLVLFFAIAAVVCAAIGLSACENSIHTNKVTATEGLNYTLSENGTFYTVSGIGTATGTKIVIASELDGIPRTERWTKTETSSVDYKIIDKKYPHYDCVKMGGRPFGSPAYFFVLIVVL